MNTGLNTGIRWLVAPLVVLATAMIGCSQEAIPGAKLDHIVVLTSTLNRDVEHWRKNGFEVVYGSKPTEARNALMLLRGGVYVEFTDPAIAAQQGYESSRRTNDILRGKQLSTFAVRPGEAAAAEHSRLEKDGIPYSAPTPMSRTRPDGQKLDWLLSKPASPLLPILIEDTSPTRLRLAEDLHPTAARKGRVVGLEFIATDMASATRQLEAVLGGRGRFKVTESKEYRATRQAVLEHGGHRYTVYVPMSNQSHLFKFARAFGDGLYAVTLARGDRAYRIADSPARRER